jgi:signal transduction histidine kinase
MVGTIFLYYPPQVLETDEMRSSLLQAQSLLGFVNVAVYSPEGRLLADTMGQQYPKVAYDQDDSFRQALMGQAVVSHRIVTENINTAYISLRVPVYTVSGDIGAVLAASVPLIDIGGVVQSQRLADGQNIFVLDDNAEFVYHQWLPGIYPEEQRLHEHLADFFEKTAGNLIAESVVDHQKKLYIYREVEGTPWRVVTSLPLRTVLASVIQKASDDIAIFALLLVCIGLIAWTLRQTRRYQQTIEQVQRERLQAVNQFAAGVAHEVRNPLTSIKGFIQLIERRPDLPVPSSYLQIVLTEIDRIEKLLNEFRLLARPLVHREYTEVDLGILLENVKLLMESQATVKQTLITFKSQPQCVVLGDVDQLKQVFINLLRNALEAVDTGGKVAVTVGRVDDWVRVSIADNGVGIPAATMAKLGTPFFTTKEAGTGLGLSICYSIVHNHGGKIKVSSNPGEGTVFAVMLPVHSSRD